MLLRLDFHLCVCSELEQYVVTLQKDSATTNRAVTLKDVEEGAVTLRKVGESLAGLKGETVKSYPNTGNHNTPPIATKTLFSALITYKYSTVLSTARIF